MSLGLQLLGPGLLESVYEKRLVRELELRSIRLLKQTNVRIEYKGLVFEEVLRFDILVEGCLLVEVKSVQEVHPIHKAQLLSYMKLLNGPIGLLMNFHELRLAEGVARMVLRNADKRVEEYTEAREDREAGR